MSALTIFTFESSSVRTAGTPEKPLFVATDVASVLGYSNVRKAVYAHVDEEDRIKVEIDTDGGRQTVICVNESGLYALIFGSKLDSAKRFKRWVTSEVLPAIRKSGRYECPANPKYITKQQSWIIQAAVQKRVHREGVDFQTVYQALKARYQIPKYTFLLQKDFDEALRFIDSCELRAPVKKAATKIEPEHQMIPPPQLSDEDMHALLCFIYTVRYLFADSFNKFYEFLKASKSPLEGECWDAFHEVRWERILKILAANGHDINDLPYFRHWKARRTA